MNGNWTYRPKSEDQIRNMWKSKSPMGFSSFDEFNRWYRESPKACHYCGLTEEESQEIVHRGLLTSKRFPLNGETRRGVFRGYWLEIDRKQSDGPYSPKNCVISCGFCNNDKSDVFNEKQYLEFSKDRVGFLRRLLNQNLCDE